MNVTNGKTIDLTATAGRLETIIQKGIIFHQQMVLNAGKSYNNEVTTFAQAVEVVKKVQKAGFLVDFNAYEWSQKVPHVTKIAAGTNIACKLAAREEGKRLPITLAAIPWNELYLHLLCDKLKWRSYVGADEVTYTSANEVIMEKARLLLCNWKTNSPSSDAGRWVSFMRTLFRTGGAGEAGRTSGRTIVANSDAHSIEMTVADNTVTYREAADTSGTFKKLPNYVIAGLTGGIAVEIASVQAMSGSISGKGAKHKKRPAPLKWLIDDRQHDADFIKLLKLLGITEVTEAVSRTYAEGEATKMALKAAREKKQAELAAARAMKAPKAK
jgi:hypothetical protein